MLSGGSAVEKARTERKSPNRGTEKDAFQFSLYFLENNMYGGGSDVDDDDEDINDNDDSDNNDDGDDGDSDVDDDNIVVTRQHDSDCVSRKFCHF